MALRKRLLSSTVMVIMVILAFLTSWGFLILALILTAGGLYEFFYLVKKKGIPIYDYTGILIGLSIPLTTFFQFQPTKGWELFFIVLVLGTVFILQFRRNDNHNAVVGIATTLFGVLYVSWLFSFTIRMRYLMPEIPGAGMRLLIFAIIVTKVGDIGALFFGKIIGKHPLLPVVSPKKTIEGGFGGLVLSGIAAGICYFLIPQQMQFSIFKTMIIGVCLGLVGQLGDMSESQIKRDCNVKDSGSMMPGLGGVLDMIDSLLFSVPVFYFYISSLLK